MKESAKKMQKKAKEEQKRMRENKSAKARKSVSVKV